MAQLELDLQEVVEDMTIEQRIDTALHPVTTTSQAIEDVSNGEAVIFLNDCNGYTVTVILNVIDDHDTPISEVLFDDQLIRPTSSQFERLQLLATDIYRCSVERSEYEGDYYDQATYGFTNSDWLSV